MGVVRDVWCSWVCLLLLPSVLGGPSEAPVGLALELGRPSREEGGNTYMVLQWRTELFAADTAVPSCITSASSLHATPSSHVEPPQDSRLQTDAYSLHQVALFRHATPRPPVSCDGLKGRSLV